MDSKNPTKNPLKNQKKPTSNKIKLILVCYQQSPLLSPIYIVYITQNSIKSLLLLPLSHCKALFWQIKLIVGTYNKYLTGREISVSLYEPHYLISNYNFFSKR